jgi:peptide/nickel transport system substrate-binding protein
MRTDRRRFLRQLFAVGALPTAASLLAACSSGAPATPANPAPTTSAPAQQAPTSAPAAPPTTAPAATAAAPASSTGAGTAVVAVSASPTGWDLTTSTWVTWQGVSYLYDTLLTTDDAEQLKPNLATEWSVSDDGLTYTLKLRPNVTFHDGTPFNADAVRFNIQRHIDNTDSSFHTAFAPVNHVDSVDDLTARIVLKQTRADFLYDLCQWGSIQLSPTSTKPGSDQSAPHPVGTGAFKFQSYSPDAQIDYARNEAYWGGSPPLNSVRVRIIPEAAVKVTEVQAKTIDVAYDLTPKDVSTVKQTGATVEQHTTPGVQFVSLNVSQAPTSELAVRKAIARAIDRDTIMQKVLFGLPEKARAGAPKNSPYYTEDVAPVDYDLKAAGDLLDQAGWTMGPDGIRQRDGQPLSLHILSTDNLGWGVFNQIFQDQLKAIGIDSHITTEEWGTYLETWRQGKEEWNLTFHHQESVFNTTSPVTASWAPSAFWNICQLGKATDPQLKQVSDQLEAINQKFLGTPDRSVRQDLAKQVQQTYQDMQLVAWLWHPPALVGVLPRLKAYDMLAHGRVLGLNTAQVS